mgnify:CR=1 FL=1
MLKALYDYGMRRRLALPPGFVGKTVKAYISLSENDDRVSIYKGDDESVPCPDIGSLANGKDKSNVLAEKRSVVIPDEPSNKNSFFMNALRDAAESEPLLKTCVHALETPEIAAAIRAELDREKIKPGDRISFRVNGQSVLRSENLRRWWQEYRKRFSDKDERPSALCLITGEPTVPMTTTTPIQGLQVVGGHASGDALICFDKSAFCSYNQKKAANAPVSEEAFCVVKAALDDLLKDAPILAGMKFVHWFDREIVREDDPLYSVDFGFEAPEDDPEEDVPVNEAEKRQMADKVPESVRSGKAAPDLDDTSYYILLLSGANSRVMIRKYERGSYADLRRNLRQWNDDLALTNQSGTGNIAPVKLAARLIRLLKFQKSDNRPFDRLSKELAGITPTVIQAILSGGRLPDAVASKALAYIRSELLSSDGESTQSSLPNSLACQWLKVWLLRKNRTYHQEVPILEEYNFDLSSTAYHCGGLMAIYAAIQRAAMPDVNTGIVERYYASAIQMPALVIGQLSSRSNHHLEKMENTWLAEKYREKLQEVSVALGTDIPATLNLEQQSYFALGYYQMGALLNREKNERIAAKKAAAEE